MDSPYASGSIGGAIVLVLGILAKLNHKRLRSNCCGKKVELSVDVEQTSPKQDETKPKIETV